MINEEVRKLIEDLVKRSIGTGVTKREVIGFLNSQFELAQKVSDEEAARIMKKMEELAEKLKFRRQSALFWQAVEVFRIIYRNPDESCGIQDIAEEMAKERVCSKIEAQNVVSSVMEMCVKRAKEGENKIFSEGTCDAKDVIRDLVSYMKKI